MSAFLGPIHFWLYEKIGNQELLTNEVAECARANGWVPDADRYTKFLPPLETVIDENNIHGWLQAQITDAETRYASLVSEILSEEGKRLEDLCEAAWQFGRERALKVKSAEEVYNAFEDFFVNGMPCDRVNAVTESSAEKISWEMMQDIHASYWNGDSSPYYVIRKRVMEGMLAETGFKLSSADDAHYSIITRNSCNIKLYDARNCPCLNVACDLYKKCDECVKRHHASHRFPLTACEICKKEGCDKADPRVYKND